MLAARFVIVALALAGRAPAVDGISKDEFRERRAALRAVLGDGITVPAGRVAGEADSSRSGFVQDSNFLYLTGRREPGAVLLLLPPSGEMLFLPARDARGEKHFGRTAAADIAAATGFERVLPAGDFESHVARALGSRLNHPAGRHVGLDVHDAGALSTSGPLEPGMVITVEPGIYLEEEGIGIRVEDVVLVTRTGAEALSLSLPREPAVIEKAPAR
ncbi:MAG: aminopeptidase P N-terminal domain-containing protein [Bryobacterales bacterium]|nr:aminopeptidase P N-terminal domain-containing protein [Bryobacterales bacterium]